MAKKLRPGKWVGTECWRCRCRYRYMNYARVKSCWFCHDQRPRKGFGGARPKPAPAGDGGR